VADSAITIARGFLFLVTGGIAAGLLIVDHTDIRTGWLLLIAVWSFCRFYYFAFNVILLTFRILPSVESLRLTPVAHRVQQCRITAES